MPSKSLRVSQRVGGGSTTGSMRTTVPDAQGMSPGNLTIPFSMTAVMLTRLSLTWQTVFVEGAKGRFRRTKLKPPGEKEKPPTTGFCLQPTGDERTAGTGARFSEFAAGHTRNASSPGRKREALPSSSRSRFRCESQRVVAWGRVQNSTVPRTAFMAPSHSTRILRGRSKASYSSPVHGNQKRTLLRVKISLKGM